MDNNYSKIKKTAYFVYGVCGFLFALFSFLYLYILQPELLTVAQYILSGGKTTYFSFLGALTITLILSCLQFGLNKIIRLHFRFYAVSYLPSCLILACITDITPSLYNGIAVGISWWVLTLIAVFYIGLVWVLQRIPDRKEARKGIVYSYLWPNLLVLSLLFFTIGTIGNTQDTLHYQLKAEKLVKGKEYNQVLNLAKKSLQSNRELTILRAYSLSRTEQMGQLLFEYPQYYGSEGLVLCPSDTMYTGHWPEEIYRYLGAAPGKGLDSATQYLMRLRQAGKATPAVADYLLCAHLLDKNLDKFVEHLIAYYPLNDSLPKHYKEAVVLYSRSRTNPLITIDSPMTVENYLDFQSYEKKFTNDTVRCNKTRDMFGNTYWWYYFYQNAKTYN